MVKKMQLKKIIGMCLLILTMLVQLLPLAVFADVKKTETVVQTLYDDARVGNYFACQVWNNRAGETGSVTASSNDVVFNGSAAHKLSNSQGGIFYSWWKTFEDYAYTKDAVKNAIKANTAYIGGWFYADGPGRTIVLIDDDVDKRVVLPENEWVFLSQKIPSTNIKQGVYDTGNTPGNIYVDDVKIVSVSDGSAPTPWERTISIPNKPDMYTKNIYTFYSDGNKYAAQRHPGAIKYIDWANTEKKTVNGAKTIKMTGELYLTPNTTFGALSDEVKTAIEEGRAYLTFWQYINKDNLSPTDKGYDAAVSWDLFFPGNVRTRGEWVWVKTPLTDINADYINFICKNAYAWIGDICISVFEDREAGFLEDKYELKIDDSIIGNEQTSISSQQTLSVSAEYFNNTKKLEKLLPMIAIYDSKGNLESFNQGEVIEIVPFRNGVLEYSYMIPKTSNGYNVKFFLWSALNEMKPIRQVEKFNILD